jgi:hypothetical protein
MIGRLWTGLAALAATLSLSSPATVARAAAVHHIVAVGDLHGDYAAWRAIAGAAGLVDGAGRWIGGKTVLVQTGDVVDRGPDGLKIIEDLMRLQREASRAHGQVITLVGNHEAMNLTGDLRYVSTADYAAYATSRSEQVRDQTYAANRAKIEAAYRARDPKATEEAIRQAWIQATPLGFLEHQLAWAPDGRVGRWIVGNPALALIDGNLFVHGGIGPAYARMPLAEINRRTAEALKAADTARDAIINDPDGPLWYRGLAATEGAPASPTEEPAAADAPAAQPPTVAEQLDEVLTAFGARRIVIAHTPLLSGIGIFNDGRLVRIDTGISAVFGGKVAYLEIVDGNLVPHEIARPTAVQKDKQ